MSEFTSKPKIDGRTVVTGMVLAAVLYAAAGNGEGNGRTRSQKFVAGNIERVLKKNDKNFAHNRTAETALDSLVTLSPNDVRSVPVSKELQFGQNLQQQANEVSLALLASGEYADNDADPHDVATALIPEGTQQALAAQGFALTELDAVSCDVTEVYWNPWDYTNHPPSETAVSYKKVGGSPRAVVRIPLGVSQEPGYSNPLTDNLARLTSTSDLPCNLYGAAPSGRAPEAVRPFDEY